MVAKGMKVKLAKRPVVKGPSSLAASIGKKQGGKMPDLDMDGK